MISKTIVTYHALMHMNIETKEERKAFHCWAAGIYLRIGALMLGGVVLAKLILYVS